MTPDDIERLARDSVEFHEEDLNSPNRREAQLARFILDVLPVVRAAEAWREWQDSNCTLSRDEVAAVLLNTIDAWRQGR